MTVDKQPPDAPARDAAGPQLVDRRAVRTEDLSEDEIAAIEAGTMDGGFAHLDAELVRIPLVDVGVDFVRKLRARGNTAEGKAADKAFCDGLFDDA